MKSVPPTPTEAVLEDLKVFTNYTIRVYAFTENGNGVPSEAVSLRTQEDGRLMFLQQIQMIGINTEIRHDADIKPTFGAGKLPDDAL